MIGDGVVVEFRQRAFLGTDAAGEIAEMIGRQRHIGVGRLADRLAVVHGLGIGEQFEIFLDPISDLVQHSGALGRRGAAPGILRRMRGIQRPLDILGVRARHVAQLHAVDRT